MKQRGLIPGITELADTVSLIRRIGLKVIRCRGKNPLDQWQQAANQTDDPDRIAGWVNAGCNLGAVIGGRIIAIDLDRHHADKDGVAAWQALGLGFDTLHQHTGSGGMHLLYELPAGVVVGNGRGALPDGIDVRSGGRGFIVVAPSLHPQTNQAYRWQDASAPVLPLPAKVLALLQADGQRQWSGQRKTAPEAFDPSQPLNTAWCGMHWPEQWKSTPYGAAILRDRCEQLANATAGGRGAKLNEVAFGVGQWMRAGHIDHREAIAWLTRACELNGLVDTDGPARVNGNIRRAIDDGDKRGKLQSPAQLTADQLEELGPVRTRIVLREGEQDRIYREIGAAMALRGCYYERGGEMVSIQREYSGRWRIKPLSVLATQREVAEACAFAKLKKRKTKGEDGQEVEAYVEAPCDVPAEDVRVWRSSPAALAEALRPLLAVSTVPVLRLADGSMQSDDGYDDVTRLEVRAKGLAVPPVQVTFTDAAEAQAVAAVAMAELMEPVEEFCFASGADRAVFPALVLTAIVRPQLATAPLFIVDSSTRGTGKGLLVDVAAIIATGHAKAAIGWPSDRSEQEKTVFSLLRMGEPFVCVDNVTEQLGGNSLDIMLTSDEFSGRVLGQSTIESLPTRMVLTATGNNVAVKGDLVRRSLRCRLVCGTDRPELRTFKRGDLLAYVSEHRGRLVGAALQVLAAFIAAGRPTSGLTRLGSFGEWSAAVRNAVVWAGESDPVATQATLEADADTAKEGMQDMLEALSERFGSAKFTVAETCNQARQGRPDDQRLLQAIIAAVGREPSDPRTPRALAAHFKRLRDRVIETEDGPARLAFGSVVHGHRQWHVERGGGWPS